MTRLRAFWEHLRGTYWAVPSAMAVTAVALSVGMVQLDEAATGSAAHGPGGDNEEFVPHLAVTVGVVLAMLSLRADLLHSSRGHVDPGVPDHRERRRRSRGSDQPSVSGHHRRGLGVRRPAGASPNESDAMDAGAREVRATTTGYVQAIDADGLMAVARERNVVVRVRARPGAFVRKGQALLTVGPPPHGDRDDAPFQNMFIVGSDRTGTQDVTFFIDQLVELAVRALSPGINDPGTARLCIDRLEQALCHLGSRRVPSPVRHDHYGHVRVFACPVTFARVLESAFDEIARYGRSSVSVTCRLLDAVRNVGSCVQHDADRQALLRQAEAIAGEVRESPFSEGDRERIARCYRATLTALHQG